MKKTIKIIRKLFNGEEIIPNAVKMASILSMSADGIKNNLVKEIENSFDENDKILPEIAKMGNNNEIENVVIKTPLTEMRISIHPGITVSEKSEIIQTVTKTIKYVEEKGYAQDPMSEEIVNAIIAKGPENCMRAEINGMTMLGIEINGQMIYVKTNNEKNSVTEKIFDAMIAKGSENCVHTNIGGVPMLGIDVDGQTVYVKLNGAE